MTHATPRPWFIDSKNFDMGNNDGKAFCSIRGMSKEDQTTPWHIAEVLASGPNPKQDAALIVKAVNTHDRAKDALKLAHAALLGQHIEGLPSKIRTLLTDMEG